MQFYAGFDVYKAQNLIDEDETVTQFSRRRLLFKILMSPTEQWGVAKQNLDDVETKYKYSK